MTFDCLVRKGKKQLQRKCSYSFTLSLPFLFFIIIFLLFKVVIKITFIYFLCCLVVGSKLCNSSKTKGLIRSSWSLDSTYSAIKTLLLHMSVRQAAGRAAPELRKTHVTPKLWVIVEPLWIIVNIKIRF